jgi:hypothetical protein
MQKAQAPIGYWLKHLDVLIEAHFDRALADHDLSRRHWQALNMLARGPLDGVQLAEGLRPFWTDGAITVQAVTGELLRRGWVDISQSRYALTPAGQDEHAMLADRVGVSRRRLMDGLTPDDYRATVAVLERMAANLEQAMQE